ncbi:MAG: ribosome silencing factor [Magnetococcales bacterium]|nr:ribosome silencing factor [Magnetococcales bacterium]
MSNMMESEQLAKQLQEVLEDKKGVDIELMDLRGRTTFTDFFLVVTGTSSTHVAALADEVDRFASQNKVQILSHEGNRESKWVLVDLGDVIVHVFLAEARELYSLDKLWSQDTLLLNKRRDEEALDNEMSRLEAIEDEADEDEIKKDEDN